MLTVTLAGARETIPFFILYNTANIYLSFILSSISPSINTVSLEENKLKFKDMITIKCLSISYLIYKV